MENLNDEKTKVIFYPGWQVDGRRPFGRLRRRWEDNIRRDLREVGVYDENWLDVAQNIEWRTFVTAAMNLRVPYAIELVSYSVKINDSLNKGSGHLLMNFFSPEYVVHISKKND